MEAETSSKRRKKKDNEYHKIPTPFSSAQLQKLFSGIDNTKIALICFLSLLTGMRVSEVLSTKVNEIEFELKRINKPRTKGGKQRVYWLDDYTLKILRKWISLLGESEYLFPANARNQNRMSRTGFYGEYRKYLAKAGLWVQDKNKTKGCKSHLFTFHTLRATFASLLVNNGVNPFIAKELLGHSKLDTTLRYYTYCGDVSQRRELDKVFGHNKSPVARKEAFEEAKSSSWATPSDSFIEEKRGYELNPLQVLKTKLVKGEIGLEEFQAKSQALLKVEELEDRNKNKQISYIG